jgi:hypothetical protein
MVPVVCLTYVIGLVMFGRAKYEEVSPGKTAVPPNQIAA